MAIARICTSSTRITLNITKKGSEAMQAQADTYKEVKTFEYPNMTIRVHIPDLSDVERNRKKKQLEKATEALLKSYMKKSKAIMQ